MSLLLGSKQQSSVIPTKGGICNLKEMRFFTSLLYVQNDSALSFRRKEESLTFGVVKLLTATRRKL